MIFYKSDISVICIDKDGEKISSPDKVEFLRGGRYVSWTSTDEPERGVVTLRITSGSRQFRENVMLLTPYDAHNPVIRDLNAGKLVYRVGSQVKTLTDSKQLTEGEMRVSEVVEFIERDATVRIPLLRPVTFRQWIMDGNKSGFIDEVFSLPWIVRDRVRLVNLHPDGLSYYDCSNLKKWEAADRNFMYLWTEGKSISAHESDPEAPEWLRIILGDRPPRKVSNYIFWDMKPGSEATERFLTEDFSEIGIGFKDMASISLPEYPFPYILAADDPDRLEEDDFWGDDAEEDKEEDQQDGTMAAGVLEAFLIASRYGSYFFIFPQLTESRYLNQDNLEEVLIDPLRAHDGGRIAEVHLKGLERLTFETYLKIDLNELRK